MKTGIDVLIVETDPELGRVWASHLERAGNRVVLADDQHSAIQAIDAHVFDVVILNVLLRGGSVFALADAVRHRSAETPVIFVNSTSFFSDGSLFALSENARAYIRPDTPPEDLTALVEHYARSA